MLTTAPERWSTSSGEATIELAAPRVVRIEMRGRVDAETGRRVAGALAGHLSQRPPKEVFFEIALLESYASEVRTLCTDALLGGWDNVVAVKVIARSRIVKMGVAVANVALKGRIESFESKAAFEASYRVACKG